MLPLLDGFEQRRLESSNLDSSPLSLNFSLILFLFNFEEFFDSMLLVSCALGVKHKANCAVTETGLAMCRRTVAGYNLLRRSDTSDRIIVWGKYRSLLLVVCRTIRRLNAICGGFYQWCLSESWKALS